MFSSHSTLFLLKAILFVYKRSALHLLNKKFSTETELKKYIYPLQ